MNSRSLTLAALFALTPSMAHAGDFDRSYDLTYSQVQARVHLCVQAQPGGWCGEVALSLTLEDGLIAQSSLDEWVEDALAAFEKSTGRVVSPRVEEVMTQAVAVLWPTLESQLNTVLSALPTHMDLDQLDRAPDAARVELYSEGEEGVPVVGSFNAATGGFELPGFYRGAINAADGYRGVGCAALPVDLAAQSPTAQAQLQGEVTAWFDLAPAE